MMSSIRLGMITPSSNTVVEPFTNAIVEGLPGVCAHYARLRVTEISLVPAALDQFDLDPFLASADLLADARMHAIAWNGTSAAWRGFDQDTALCEAVESRYAVPATASMAAINAVLNATGAKRIGLVTPYLGDVQSRIVENYTSAGYTIVAERHLDVRENFTFSEIDPETIADLVRAVATPIPDAIIIVCTNLRTPDIVSPLEGELDIPIYDSLSTVVWHAARLAGVDARQAQGWGRLFDTQPL
ncbi:MAG: maleate cis-trans isomerase family protein [Gammaproteobacteria bacterium]